jgi:hypothetical protein
MPVNYLLRYSGSDLIQMTKDIVEERHRGDGSDKQDLVNMFMEYRDSDGMPIQKDQMRGEVLATLIAGKHFPRPKLPF